MARSPVDLASSKFGFGAQGPKMGLPIRYWSGKSRLGRGDCPIERRQKSRNAAADGVGLKAITDLAVRLNRMEAKLGK